MTETSIKAHTLSHEQTLQVLSSNAKGLSVNEVHQRQQQFGRNEFEHRDADTIISIFFHQFASPLIYILLIAGLITLAMEQYSGGVFIFCVVLVNAIIGTLQEYSANRSAEALQKMVTQFANVIRDQQILEIDAAELVPGDIVIIESGNKVPADIRLLSSQSLKVDESLLTGESISVDKDALPILDDNTSINDQVNMLFAGTLVSQGRAIGVVVSTGHQTKMGEVAKLTSQKKQVSSPLIRRMKQFTLQISLAIGGLIVIISAVLFWQGYDWQHIFLLAIGIAVSAIPEGLPVTLTITLAVGLRRMAKRNVIVRKLVAVESLGSCTLIASDKTGTLTKNELAVEAIALPAHNGLLELQDEKVKPLLEAAILANEAHWADRDQLAASGDAVDCALLVAAAKAGIEQSEYLKEQPQRCNIPYEPQLKCCASIHNGQDQTIVYVKGAVEALLDLCDTELVDSELRTLHRDEILQQERHLSDQQYRVLAFARGQALQQEHYQLEDLHQLTFLGMVGMRDPLREDAKSSIQACHEAGVGVVMVTGDQPNTALSIARELGIANTEQQVLSGADIRNASSSAFEHIEHIKVYARVEPGQKLDIVNALIQQGECVAVTGDGVNDAPALKHAHVGVAMGQKGTDIARESADIIVTDDNFSSIVSGIEEGRTAYNNIRKIIFFLIATSTAEVFMFLGTILLGLPIPLFATQLLWLNFVTSIIQDVAHAFDPPEKNILKRPPRPPSEALFDRLMIRRIFIASSFMGVISLLEFYLMIEVFAYPVEEARNLLLLQFVLFENVIALNSQSEHASLFSQPFLRNPLLIYGTLFAQLLHIAALYVGFLRDALETSPVSLTEWLILLTVAIFIMLVVELEKWSRRKNEGAK